MQGLGEDVLADILRCSRPSHVVTMQTPNARRNVPDGCFWAAPGEGNGPLAAPAAAAQAAITQLPAVASEGPLGATRLGELSLCWQPVPSHGTLSLL